MWSAPENFTNGFPAATKNPLYAPLLIQFFTPPTRDPTVEMWDFEIERELPSNMMVSLGYVGNHGTHLVGEALARRLRTIRPRPFSVRTHSCCSGIGHRRGRLAGREPLCQTKWLKAVPDAEDGLDVLLAILPEFLPQAANVHIQRARANLIAVTPDTHEQNLAGDDFAGVLHQEGKQLVFFPRQNEVMRVESRALAHEIHFQVRILVPIRRI
jgi:hypothetical protein